MIFDNGDDDVVVVVDATVYNSTACFDRTSTRHGGNDDDDGIVAELIPLYVYDWSIPVYESIQSYGRLRRVDVVYYFVLLVLGGLAIKSKICVWLLKVTS